MPLHLKSGVSLVSGQSVEYKSGTMWIPDKDIEDNKASSWLLGTLMLEP